MNAIDTQDNSSTRTIECRCGATLSVYSWWCVTCHFCKREYNGSGQLLRQNWRDNPSLYDEDVSDLDGYEMSCEIK